MDIRRAAAADADTLTGIAFAAKQYWGYPEKWLEIWKPGLTIHPEFIAENDVFVAIEKDELVGFYAIIQNGENFQLEHLWVKPAFIGGGIGKALFRHAADLARSLGSDIMMIESDPNAEAFYRKMGAERVGEKIGEIDGMERRLPLMKIIL